MKTKIKFVFLPTILLFFIAATLPRVLLTNDLPDNFGDFTKKSYYKTIFTDRQQAKLSGLNALYKNTNNIEQTLSVLIKKQDNYNKIAEVAKRARDRRKALRKAARLDKKIAKKGIEIYTKYQKANTEKFSIYKLAFATLQKDKSAESEAGIQLAKVAQKAFEKSISMIKNAENQELYKKYSQLKEANKIQIEAIRKQEIAFGYVMKDSLLTVNKSVTENNEKIIKKTTDSTKIKENTQLNIDSLPNTLYNAQNDVNLYRSYEKEIYQKVGLTPQEQQLLVDANQKIAAGNILTAKIDTEYKKVALLQQQASAATDIKTKELLKQQAQEKEMYIFAWMLKTANLYSQANIVKTDLYTNNLTEAKKNAPEKEKDALVFEKKANSHILFAENLITRASLEQYKSEQYLTLMEAIMLQHDAIKELELAFGQYYNIDMQNPENIATKNNGESEIAEINKTNTKNTHKKVVYKYIYKNSWQYSAENPKHKPFIAQSGITFRVQMSVGLNLLNAVKYLPVSPIIYDTFKDNNFKRFYAGNYVSVEAVTLAKKILQKKGARSDIKVVAFANGKLIAYKSAVAKVNKNAAYKKTMEKELALLAPKQQKNTHSNTKTELIADNTSKKVITKGYGSGKHDFAIGKNISTVKGLAYAVQIGLFALPKTNKDLAGVSPLFTEDVTIGTKYFAGTYTTKQKADAIQKQLVNAGHKGAFVVAYFNGQKIKLSKAAKIEKKTRKNIKKTSQTEEIIFKIQIGAYTSLTKETKNLLNRFQAKKFKVNTQTNQNGLTIYTVGNVKTYEEAKMIKKQLKGAGLPEGFVIAYLGNKKIKAGEAINILKSQIK